VATPNDAAEKSERARRPPDSLIPLGVPSAARHTCRFLAPAIVVKSVVRVDALTTRNLRIQLASTAWKDPPIGSGAGRGIKSQFELPGYGFAGQLQSQAFPEDGEELRPVGPDSDLVSAFPVKLIFGSISKFVDDLRFSQYRTLSFRSKAIQTC
jgi:hypothetical protein